MASIRKRGLAYRVEVYKSGQRESASFPTRQQASAWAVQREAELGGTKLPSHTIREALRKFAEEVSPKRRGARWEATRLKRMERDKLADVYLPGLRAIHIAEWRERRLKLVSGASVRREMNLLQAVLKICRREWGWLAIDPIKDVGRPPAPPARRRRISQDEIDRITLALGYNGGAPKTSSDYVALTFLFAIETAMRSGEILDLRWADVSGKAVELRKTKNGDRRRVPLSVAAREIISLLPRSRDQVFVVSGPTRDALFRRARRTAEIADLHFHDSRAEAIWRLSKKLDVMELARMIGHRDIRSLMHYYAASAEELADRLG